jgi:hypothetical protein
VVEYAEASQRGSVRTLAGLHHATSDIMASTNIPHLRLPAGSSVASPGFDLNTFDAIYCGWYRSATQRVLDTTLLRALVQELGCTLTQPFSCCEIMTDAA